MKAPFWMFPLASVACYGPMLCDTLPENHPAVLVFDSAKVGDVQLAAGEVAAFRLEGDAHDTSGSGFFILRGLTGGSAVDVELLDCGSLASTLAFDGDVADLERSQPFDPVCGETCEVCLSFTNPGLEAVDVSFVLEIDLMEELECGGEVAYPGVDVAPVEPLESTPLSL